MNRLVFLVLAVGLLVSRVAGADAFWARLPEDLREARGWLKLDEKAQARWLAYTDGDFRRALFRELALLPPAAGLVLQKFPDEPAQIQHAILSGMRKEEHWLNLPRVDEVLSGVIADARDTDVVVSAANTLQILQAKRLRAAVAPRLRGDQTADAVEKLEALDDRLALREKLSALPGFWRTAPPLFSVRPAEGKVRFVVIGDFGTGTPAQRGTAAAMGDAHRNRPFDFGITVGDNFYESGLPRVDDPRWHDWWEKLYGPLGITFYPTLGNHDFNHPDSPVAEILYSAQSKSWHLPSRYYTFTAGAAQFFAIDTVNFTAAQARWLAREIAASSARWKIVYGHHPISETNEYGTAPMRAQLWPVIRGKVDAYFCGHTHSLGQMRTEDGVHFFIVGGGGRSLYVVKPEHPDAVFVATSYGFSSVEVGAEAVEVVLHSGEGRELHRAEIRK